MAAHLDVSIGEFELEVRSDPVHYVTFDLNGAGTPLLAFSVVLYGWALRNVSGSTLATLDIYDNNSVAGIPVFPINLAANETSREWFGDRGLMFLNGLYVNVTAQEVKGSIFYRHHRPG